MPRFPSLPILAATGLLLGAGAARAQDCLAVMASDPRLGSFVEALNRTGQAELLHGAGPFTILAPDNGAIDRVPVNIRNDLMGSQPGADVDPVRGPAVVNAQMIDGRHLAREVQGRDRVTVRTRNGNQLLIQRESDGQYTLTPERGGFGAGGIRQVDPAHVVQADIPCSNGVVHIVDRVLVR
ncbi:fasciclin domain-containing protein [Belnapia sp. T6]|uniref:Fasciclin domain-containing protein n=1 Tax=Belnapia mucosa TaxID=2804532 RepID=A0ABS1UYG5_9PROT|nr:fasciclin domain-containing protein [Belnapia mucosa]MBL6454496.1 fasciclin domain-containing protein [Belnapia mucosa]